MKTPKLLLLAASAVASAAFSLATANAAPITIAQWNFATVPSSGLPNLGYTTAQPTETTAVNQTVTPWTPPAGITVSTLTLGSGATPYGPAGYIEGAEAYLITGTSSGIVTDVTKGSYEKFTITIDAGHTLSLTGVTLATGNNNVNVSGGGNSYFSSSVTGQTTALGSGANGYLWRQYEAYSHYLATYTVDLTSTNLVAGTSLQNLTNTSVDFYVPIDFNNSGLPAGIQNLTLNGNLSAVPEPATWALLAFSLTTVMVFRRRRRA